MTRDPRLPGFGSAPWLRPVVLAALGAIFAVSLAPPADASSSYAASLDDVARVTTLVARVTPLHAVSAWEEGRIVTTTNVRIDTVVAGTSEARTRSTFRVRSFGGIVDGIGQHVEGEPSLPVGVPSVLFVAPLPRDPARFAVVAGAQGQIAIDRDATRGELARIRGTGLLLARPLRVPNAPAGRLMTTLDGASVSEATTLAAEAWTRTHAR